MQVRNIPLVEIVPSELNPRKTFNQEELQELAQSIQENGLVQPITLRKTGNKKEAKYEIVCGERRFRASQLIGATTIQSIVKDLDDKQAFACMIIENLQRKDIDPMEEAAALHRLYSDGAVTIADMAKMLGKSTSFVSGRIQLHNTIPQFVQLMRDGILVLTHLLDICKMPAEQQETLYEACFTEASRERWPYKFPNMPQLHEMIDEHVMNQLSLARFSLSDATLNETCACSDCPLNTANNPDNTRDASSPRCMKRECFIAKTRETIFREAKEKAKEGVLLVFDGDYSENEDILRIAEEYGLEISGLGNRQYVPAPVAPDPEMYKDEETYAKRKANYDKIRAVFDDNLADGTLTPVYEVCYSGIISGEKKYVYSIPDTEDEPFAADKVADNNRRISELKVKLHEADDHRKEDLVEKQRSFMEKSEYSHLNMDLTPTEDLVFRALILKRLPLAFKETIGCSDAQVADFRAAKKAINDNINCIAREFIRSILSEKSVNYSADLAGMLNAILEERYSPDVDEMKKNLDARYNQSKSSIKAKIDELREENEKEKQAQKSVQPAEDEKDSESESEVVKEESPVETEVQEDITVEEDLEKEFSEETEASNEGESVEESDKEDVLEI